MSVNRFMHPRNIYKTPPDFNQLAIDYEEFRRISKMKPDGKVHIDFGDEESLRTLTRCLLKKDFNLDVILPPNQLVPTLPLRLNYILWIEDIMQAFNFTNIVGVDVGCGASCIYPLLGVKQNADWHMYATELNEESAKYARENVNRNGLLERITILNSSGSLVANLNQNNITSEIHFTICNPPFFSENDSPNDRVRNRTGKRKSANNAKTGIECELSTAGGEIEFVSELINESKILKDQVKVFTTMLGQKTSLSKIINVLTSNGIYNFCTSEFCQGRTTRWGIAWTFNNQWLLRTVPILGQSQPKSFNKICLENVKNISKANIELVKILESLVDSMAQNQLKKLSEKKFHLIALNNTWSNQRRKRREQQRNANSQCSTSSNDVSDDHSLQSAPKRIKIDNSENTVQTDDSLKTSIPLLHVEVVVELLKSFEFKSYAEITLKYLNGSAGMNGIHEMSQYIQNKWNQLNHSE